MAINTITTVAEFAAAIADLPLKKGCVRFFRGHSDYQKYKLEPYIYRKQYLIDNEENLIREAILRSPEQLPSSLSFFETLVRLQHYGLPTRLLDLTANALVALYFACRHKEKTQGEVIIFDIPKEHVKYYDSDTASIISNISRRDVGFDLNALPKDKEGFNNNEECVGRLLHDIKSDKPAFRHIIEPDDLKRVIAVRAKLDNARIARQEGAFLLFGINGKKTECASIPTKWIVCGNATKRIVFSNKHKIKRELLSFGVSEQSLFPELESQTQAIVSHFSGKYSRNKP